MPDVVLRAEHVTKRFGGITALENAELELYKGEVHALVGANGAGKSTLIKIITGAYPKDEGDIYLEGQKIEIKSTFDARAQGISAVYQEFSLINTVSVAENIFMGKLLYNNLGPIPRADWKRMNEETQKLLDSLGVTNIKPESIVGKLSVAQKQMVEIAKALSNDLKVLIMDEPTASLSDNEIDNMFKIVKELKAKGISIVYVSHRLEELPIICDRISVYRDGHYIKTLNIEDAPKQVIIENMVGKHMTQTEQVRCYTDEVLLEARNFSSGKKFQDINITLHKGEILGIAGLAGAGRTEFVRALFGADPKESGQVFIEGKEVHIEGIGYFYPTLAATGKVTRSTPHKTNKVAFKTVRFRPDSNLKGHFVGVRANQSKYVRHSEKVSEVEIDMLLKEYFAEHQMMTRRDFQEVCGLARTTAKMHLVRLRGEGKLVNIGLRNQPMYVPAPGYYGVSRDAAHPSR